jgi:hypothetical protein
MSLLEIKILNLALIGFAWAMAKFLFRGMRLHAWMKLIDALRYPQLSTEYPAIKDACMKYRTSAIVEYAYPGLIMAVALTRLFSNPR